MRLSKEESNSLYIVKAIGIMFVVTGHYTEFMTVAKPYYFHMPMFFFIGGITLKDAFNIKGILKTFWSSAFYLVTRYVIIGCVAITLASIGFERLHNPFGDGILDSISKAYFGNMHNNQLFLVAWFLVAYICALIFSTILVSTINRFMDKSLTSSLLLMAIAISCGLLSVDVIAPNYQQFKIQSLNLSSQALYGSMFMIAGYVLRDLVMKLRSLIALLVLFLAVTAITGKYEMSPMIMSWSEYKDGFFLSTLIAAMLICCVFIFANVFGPTVKDKSIFINVGKNTKSIMSWHLTVFIIVDYVYSSFFTDRLISSYSVFDHFHSSASVVIYSVCGVLIPTFLSKLAPEKNKIYSIIKSKTRASH